MLQILINNVPFCASGEGPDIIMDGTNYQQRNQAGNVESISDYDFVKSFVRLECRFAVLMEKFMIPSYGWFSGIWSGNASILEECGVEFQKHLMSLLLARLLMKRLYCHGFGFTVKLNCNIQLTGSIWKILIIIIMKANPDGTDFDTKFALGEMTYGRTY